jgi:LacI family transcriptional regulator
MKRNIGLKHLAEDLGLSQSTISRALKRHPAIPEGTRERVEKAAMRLGYQPNLQAQGLATGRAMAIGLVFPLERLQLVQTNFVDILSGISDGVTERGYSLLLTPFRGEQEPVLRRLSTSGAVDGVIITRPLVHDPRIALLQKLGIPFVVHGRSEVETPYSFVDIDNFEVFRKLTDVLLDYGHRDIAVMNSFLKFRYAAARRDGHVAALAARGLTFDQRRMHETNMTEQSGYELASKLFVQPEPPKAIICGSIFLARGVYRAAAEKGLMVGRDISVVSHDDMLRGISASDFMPQITATQYSVEASGRRLAEVLIDMIEGKAGHGTVGEVANVDLVLRGSIARHMGA